MRDPLPPQNLAGYKVYYGKSSRNYDTCIDVFYQTRFPLNNLGYFPRPINDTYYFAVTAYDYNGKESNYSNEVSYSVSSTGGTLVWDPPPPQNVDGYPDEVTTWVDTVGLVVNGNSITKTAPAGWGNGGAASLERFTSDGGVEFVASSADASANGRPMCGLSSINLNASYDTIEYAIFLRNTGSVIELKVYESGIDKGVFGNYQAGDIFRVERIGSTIVYKKNGVIFYTSGLPTDLPLLIDAAIYNNGGELRDIMLFGADID